MSSSEPESISSHELELQRFCRVCARSLTKGYKHTCSSSGSLLEPFGIDIATDESAIHPPFYCHNCHSTAKTLERVGWAVSSVAAHQWSAHSEEECEVCAP